MIYYSFLTYSYTKLTGLAFAYGFFLTGFAVQKLIVAPLASLVFRQEKLEVRRSHSYALNLSCSCRPKGPRKLRLQSGPG